MVLPVINRIVGGARAPHVPIWNEITQSYKEKSAEYWWGVKIREKLYRARETTPSLRTCQACM